MLSFFRLVVEDMKAQREGLFAQGFWALAIYRFAHLRIRVRFKVIRAPWWLLNVLLQKFSEFAFGICIPEGAVVGRRVRIEHFGPIVIHGSARIGDECLLRQGVTIGNKGDSDPLGAPNVGRGVEIGAGAVVVGRISVGDGAVIGANAVVTKDVPPWAVMVGAPARQIGMRKHTGAPVSANL